MREMREKGLPQRLRQKILKWALTSWPYSNLRRYLYAFLLVALVTLLGVPIHFFIHPTNLVMLYLAIVVVAAVFLGRGPSIAVSLLGVLAFDFFFVNPRLTLSVDDTQYLLTFLGLLVVGLIISSLAARVKDQVEEGRRREAQTAALYSFSRDLATAGSFQAVLNTIVAHFTQVFKQEAAILLPGSGTKMELRAASPGMLFQPRELEAAERAFLNPATAERNPMEPGNGEIFHMPLITTRGPMGVLSFRRHTQAGEMEPAQHSQLEAYANLAGLALERALLEEQANQAEVHQATERLQTALLNSISHDLRTPLATITGVLDSMLEVESGANEEVFLEKPARLELIESARGEAQRLNRLVGDLLDMTRLESGALRLNLEETDVQDLIGTSIGCLGDTLTDHPIQAHAPNDLPMVRLDFILMEQVLINLLDNAAKYSPPSMPIEVTARLNDAQVEVAVADRGIGIPPADLQRVFDKFFRIQRADGARGTGLGLAICKGIVEAHGGTIRAENRAGGGVCLTLSIPVGGSQPLIEADAYEK